MNLAPKAFAQQRQSTLITHQVIQSIKFLQFGQDELTEFLREQAEGNPLLQIVTAPGAAREVSRQTGAQPGTGERARSSARAAPGRLPSDGGRERANIEDFCAARISLREHLRAQASLIFRTARDQVIAGEIVESIDQDGYLRRDLDDIADVLGVRREKIASVLATVQRFDPIGVGARDLLECLRLQLRERNALTGAMEVMLANLKLLADYDIARLSKLCGVTRDKVLAMAGAIRELDPRPGRRFDWEPVVPALPDVLVELKPDGTFAVELNARLLPRILIDQSYQARIVPGALGQHEARFLGDCRREANWLSRNLQRRARTILKVAAELVRRQREFLLFGVEHLKPLCLRDVAEAVGLHESTVCRAVANKYMMTNRGMIEMKYLFASAITSADSDADFAAATIRHRIRELVNAETCEGVLSDDAIVGELRKDGVDIARRTVAKYREMMGIPSSLRRKRRKEAERMCEDGLARVA